MVTDWMDKAALLDDKQSAIYIRCGMRDEREGRTEMRSESKVRFQT